MNKDLKNDKAEVRVAPDADSYIKDWMVNVTITVFYVAFAVLMLMNIPMLKQAACKCIPLLN